MKLKVIKQTILVSCFLFFSIACSNTVRMKKTVNVSVQVINESINKPRQGIEVRIFKIEKPIFSMWQFHELTRINTDSIGVCNFKLNKGHYSLRFYDKEKLLYSTDELEINNLNKKRVTVKW